MRRDEPIEDHQCHVGDTNIQWNGYLLCRQRNDIIFYRGQLLFPLATGKIYPRPLLVTYAGKSTEQY